MRIIFAVVILLIVLIAGGIGGLYSYLGPDEPPPKIPAPSSIRVVNTGEMIGFQGGQGAHAWLGIPYAEPPVGELRWKGPRSPRPWRDRREFIEYRSRCPQLPGLAPPKALPIGDEDCLHLNVWAPIYHAEEIPQGAERRPVMVWIHGGGNSLGGADFPLYDGALYAAEHQAVVVSINYRLGPFGWFRHRVLREQDGSAEDNSGNFGTLDIIQALRWVKRNIGVFGGNPDNVTLFGESAGGNNVLSMMASPVAAGLFHRAIVQSAAFNLVDTATAENLIDDAASGDPYSAGEIVVALLRTDGLAADRQTAKNMIQTMDRRDLARYLRSKTIREIFSAYDKHLGGMLQMPLMFGDGHVLPKNMTSRDIFSHVDRYNEVPVILGANRDEVKLFMSLNPEMVKTRFRIPVEIKDPVIYERNNRYGSDAMRAAAVDELAALMRNAQGPSVWAYRFDVDDWRNLGFIDLKQLLGAAHAMEIPFVFGRFPKPLRIVFAPSLQPEYDIVSNAMMSYWAEFAYRGNPGRGHEGEELPWTPWENQGAMAPRIMVFDTELDQGIRMTADRLSIAAVKNRFRDDRSFTPEEQCRAYPVLFWFAYDDQEFENLGCQ